MSASFEPRRDGTLLAALVVAAVLASGVFTNPSRGAQRAEVASNATQVPPAASPVGDYVNAVADATAAADGSPALASLLAP
jgi:hypothetical protein